MSTTEAEFVAAAEATKEAVWLRKLLLDVGHACDGPTLSTVDNQSAIKLILFVKNYKKMMNIWILRINMRMA